MFGIRHTEAELLRVFWTECIFFCSACATLEWRADCMALGGSVAMPTWSWLQWAIRDFDDPHWMGKTLQCLLRIRRPTVGASVNVIPVVTRAWVYFTPGR